MITKDFMKKILKDEKKLFSLIEVKPVKIPCYDELSVKRYWRILREDSKFMKYMPDFPSEDRIPDREFFWNIAHTIYEKYV